LQVSSSLAASSCFLAANCSLDIGGGAELVVVSKQAAKGKLSTRANIRKTRINYPIPTLGRLARQLDRFNETRAIDRKKSSFTRPTHQHWILRNMVRTNSAVAARRHPNCDRSSVNPKNLLGTLKRWGFKEVVGRKMLIDNPQSLYRFPAS
jgi:hypothetical protein